MPSSDGFRGIRRTLEHRNYRIYTAGNFVSLIGTWIQRIAVGWLTWELTESGAWLGVVAFADLFPSVLIGPFGGAVADRVSRIRIMAIAQSLAMIQAIALFVLTASGLITVEILIGLVLIQGVVVGFNQPARLAMVPSLVPRADLPVAVAINAIIFNLARFIGPAIAGLLIVSSGVAAAFAANAVSFLAFLIALSQLNLDLVRPEALGLGGRRSLLGDVADGLRYTARHPGIGPMLLLLTVLSISVRPFVELLPGFAADVYGRGAEGLAILSSTIGIAAVLSGLWLAQRGTTAGLATLVLAAVLGVAAAILGFVATDLFWVAVPCVALAGICMVIGGVGAQTLLQLSVDGAMRGRVMSLYGLIFRGGPAAGALIMGVISEATGLRWPLAGGALIAAIVWAWTWRRRASISAALDPGGQPVPTPEATRTAIK